MPYVSTRNVPKGDSLDLQRGDTWSISCQRMGDVSGRTKLWFTLKEVNDDADALAWVQIEETVGLEYIGGAAAGTPANGSITVIDAVKGDLTVALAAVEAAKLENVGNLFYDLQMLTATGVTTLTRGRAVIMADSTRTTS